MDRRPKPYQQFERDFPQIFQAYENLGEAIATAGPLDAKTRELIRLGMAAADRGRSAVKSHTHRALDAGASAAEVTHAALLAITTLGFPSMMTTLMWVQEAVEAHQGGRQTTG